MIVESVLFRAVISLVLYLELRGIWARVQLRERDYSPNLAICSSALAKYTGRALSQYVLPDMSCCFFVVNGVPKS